MSRKPELRGRAARLARLFPTGPAQSGGIQAARTPFVLLVVLLLGGGLIALLVLNSALSEGQFKLDDLQKQTKSLTDEEQALQRDVDAYSAPDALQRRAHELGMVPGGDPAFLDPNGTVKGVPEQATAEKTVSTPAVLAPEALISRPSPSPTPAAGAAAPVITPTPTPARSVPPVKPAQSTTVQSSTPTTPGR
ncbi:septum formation initiator family protein [Streptomyces sp. MBT53]|uniref:septum formation initiator family protein n=1 Tax=Streptomyces sp. MBT53 TaxID=1488384 RepID=UPI00191158E7|nr:septum formation initiator family protein [Streptomyces sp. MBT53]MBK6011864.1 septum formation initiator family protein [Streptomyces sp. MBT53]